MSGHGAAKAQGDVAGVLRLVGYIGFAVALMVLDRRFAALEGLRSIAAVLAEPVLRVAELPGRGATWLRYVVVEREQLAAENRKLREALLLSQQQRFALQSAVEQIRERERLLNSAPPALQGVLARIIALDLGGSRARVRVDRGRRQGVSIGDAVLDPLGIYGQVVRVGPDQAEVLMLSDADHAIPVQVERSGLRAVAQGSGLDAPLRIDSVPLTADIRSGDTLLASGLGGRFPTGFPVGTVLRVRREDGAAFLSVEIEPAARLQASRELLLARVPALEAQPLEGPEAQPAVSTDATAPENTAAAPADAGSSEAARTDEAGR